MSILKCKMCGGDLRPDEGATTCECEYCGSVQTIPTVDNEKKGNLFNRANRLRMAAEYDKAATVYTSITAEFPEESEAYWGLVLCKFGIEYVDDPVSGRKIPTCHRTRSDSILDDSDFEQACENADTVAKKVYREEAKAIDRLQQVILSVVANESPYDVFICYKETGEDGERTEDSVLGQETYDALTAKGLKVFFARITLEDKLGQQYEPYIYAALHSAKVMLAIGTQFEYFDAVWVKNEWARFLDMMKEDRTKTLIPCYKGIDAYDMPREFKNLQAQDMGKLGWLQDLSRGVIKLCGKEEDLQQAMAQRAVTSSSMNAENFVRRARLFMEDGNWDSASEYLDRALDEDAEYAKAYAGKVQVALKLRKEEELSVCMTIYEDTADWQKAIRFANQEQKEVYENYVKSATIKREEKRRKDIYVNAEQVLKRAWTLDSLQKARKLFESITGYKDADQRAKQCRGRIEEKRQHLEARNNAIAKVEALKEEYQKEKESIAIYKQKAIEEKRILGFLEDHNKEVARLRKEYDSVQEELQSLHGIFTGKRRRELEGILAQKKRKLDAALSQTNNLKKQYDEAHSAVYDVPQSLIADERELTYQSGEIYYDAGIYDLAVVEYNKISGYKDVDKKTETVRGSVYQMGKKMLEEGNKARAYVCFLRLGDYKDAKSLRRSLQPAISNLITGGTHHTIGLKVDGEVVAAGSNVSCFDKHHIGQCEVSDWENIVAVSACHDNTVGLKSDGTVIAVGDNEYGQCNVTDWKDIVDVSAGGFYTVGLKSDGTVVAVGMNKESGAYRLYFGQCDVADWTDIVAVSAGGSHTVGLRVDGTVVAVGRTNEGQCAVTDWKDIVAVSAGGSHTVGLRVDGTVVAIGKNTGYDGEHLGQCDISDWKDIVAVCAGAWHTVGLKRDGTVVAVGRTNEGQCAVTDWKDIVAVSASGGHTVGLKADGTVIAVGDNKFGQCEVAKWKLWD